MALSNSALEKLERKYFENILYILEANKHHIEDRLKSGTYVKESWKPYLKKKSEIDSGAERVIRAVLLRTIQWAVNSTPISSDLCFEVENEAILHLDCKTVESGDEFGDDLRGTFLVHPSQSSFPGEYNRYDRKGKCIGTFQFKPKLPAYYKHKIFGKIPCLTYFVKFVYKIHNYDFKLRSTSFYCMPNRQLSYYGNLVAGVKTYDEKARECMSTRIDAKRMMEIGEQKAQWKRGKEEF